ncbi:hypothetical protein F4604DRAFT_1921903 [Suillus subluteus]|nr:hypothetical protein F4604DRAFT_1921903 [Suillus subluteus]
MGPSRTSRSKYNHSEQTLTGQHQCPHCNKKFKIQGFKKHEISCKKRRDIEKEQHTFALEHEWDQRRARQQAHMGIRLPSAGPSMQSVENIPDTNGELIIPAINPDPPLDFKTLDNVNFEGAIDNSPINSRSGSVKSPPAISAQQPLEFQTEYHPSADREPLHQAFNEFGINAHPEEQLPVDEAPWRPFRSRGNFEFAEIALDATLNNRV